MSDFPNSSIAIIGLACRVPGARNAGGFWAMLREGRTGVRRLSEAELRAAGVPDELLRDRNYVRSAATVEGVEEFDAAFFGFSPREAAFTDPQHRLFLETCWEALDDATYPPGTHDRIVGVYGGCSSSSYLIENLLPAFSRTTSAANLGLLVGNDKDYLVTQASYRLNLRGPSVGVQTACSSSLVAVHMACQSLLGNECDMALAGGVTIRVPQAAGYLFQEGGLLSPDGCCRSFDAEAAGTIFGSGVGVVVLKRLEDALTDGDAIRAVLLGSAVNNDARRKVGFTAPSIEGQATVIAEALEIAGLAPADLDCVETHGTATRLGDAIELTALAQVFSDRTEPCLLTAAKSTVGHLEAAAGVTGLIKTVLSLEAGELPPVLHYRTPTEELLQSGGRLRVNAKLTPWGRGARPRRAGVSSFGVGGTNVHVVLQEAPLPCRRPAARQRWHLLQLSAPDADGLERQAARLARHVDTSVQDIADVAHTLAHGRTKFPLRRVILARDAKGAASALRGTAPSSATRGATVGGAVAFLASGQGRIDIGPIRELYEAAPDFRDEVDSLDAVTLACGGVTLASLLRGAEDAPELTRTRHQQSALLTLQLAQAALWRCWGVVPAVVLGHSLGEVAAAALANLIEPASALRFVHARARLMEEEIAPGSMLAVVAELAVVQRHVEAIGPELAIAAINGRRSIVVAGPSQAVLHLKEELRKAGVVAAPLGTQRAFHSAMIDPVLAPLGEAAAELLRPGPGGTTVFVSSLTGSVLAGDVVCTSRHWIEHARQPVRFAEGLDELRRLGVQNFVELGAGETLTRLGQQALSDSDRRFFASIQPGRTGMQAMLTTAAGLVEAGAPIDLRALAEPASRVHLPPYTFAKTRHWIERPRTAMAASIEVPPETARRFANGSIVVDATFDLSKRRELRDHRVFGRALLPLAEVLATVAHGLWQVLPGRRIELCNIVVRRPIWLDENEPIRLQVILTPDQADGYRLCAYARGAALSIDWVLVLEAVAPSSNSGSDQDQHASEMSGGEDVPPARYYATLGTNNSEMGPGWQSIRALRRGLGEASAELRLPVELEADPGADGRYAALLDGAMHAAPAALPDEERTDGRPMLPVSIRHLLLLPFTGAQGRVTARLRAGSHAGERALDVILSAPDGRSVAVLQGLVLRRSMPAALATTVAATPTYRIDWQAAPAIQAERLAGVTIVAGSGRLADRLHAALAGHSDSARRLCAPDELGRVLAGLSNQGPVRLLIAAGDEESGDAGVLAPVSAAFGLFKAVLASEDGVRTWFVTAGAQAVLGTAVPVASAQAAIGGLARSAALEHARSCAGLIDLDPDTREIPVDLLMGLLGNSQEGFREVAIRRGTIRLPRLMAVTLPETQPPVGPEGVYAVLGGTGSLGHWVARWLIAKGALHVVIVGRRTHAATDLAMLRHGGPTNLRLETAQCAVDDPAALDDLLTRLGGQPGGLRGVVHAAGVVEQTWLARAGWESLERVLRPKMLGGRALADHALQNRPDWVVLFSSLLGVTGAPGQAAYAAANAYLDGLAAELRSAGVKAVSIAWGPWSGEGMAARAAVHGAGALGDWLVPQSPEKALSGFGRMLAADEPALISAEFDWQAYSGLMRGRGLAMLTNLAAAHGPARSAVTHGRQTLREEISALHPKRRHGALLRSLTEQVASLLPASAARQLGPDDGLFESGLDSLSALEFRDRLERETGLELSAAVAIENSTIRELADHLLRLLDLGETATAPTEPAVPGLRAPASGQASPAARIASGAPVVAEPISISDEDPDELLRELESQINRLAGGEIG